MVDENSAAGKQALMLRGTGFTRIFALISALKIFLSILVRGFGEFKSKEGR
jgi:hypothetical protein